MSRFSTKFLYGVTSVALASAAMLAVQLQAHPAHAAPPPMVMALPVSGNYTIDPTHSQVRATWNHMGLSRPGATFEQVEGTIVVDTANPAQSSVSVRIPMSSLDTGVPDLDKHFHSAVYFDSGKFPDATFVSRSVQFTGMGNAFTVTGDLTIKGVTKPVTLHAMLNGAGVHPMTKSPAVGFSAKARLKRSDFGISAAIPLVSDEIELSMTAEAGMAK